MIMNRISNTIKIALLMGVLLAVLPAAIAQESKIVKSASEVQLRLNFRGVPLDKVLDYFSQEGGFVIMRDADVTERVDVLSHKPLNRDEAVNLLNSVLLKKGYTAVRNDRTLTIVSLDSARKHNLPVIKISNPEDIPKTDDMVTHVVPIRYADAMKIIDVIQPLLPEYAVISSNESSNAVVITDTQMSARRMVEIIKALDTSISSISNVKVFPLQYADATEIAKVINEIFKTPSTGNSRSNQNRMERMFRRMGRGGSNQAQQGTGNSEARKAAITVVAVAEERTNSLVVSAPDEVMPTIEGLVEEIDTMADDITAIKVFTLRYADAEEMAQLITSVFQANASNSQNQRQRGPRFFGGGGRRSGTRSNQQPEGQRAQQETEVRAVADLRTNSVVVSAASETLSQIAQMVRDLDNDPAKDKDVFVYEIKNADVEEVAEILRSMFEEQNSGNRNNRNTNRNARTNNSRNNSSSRNSGRSNNSSMRNSGSSRGF
jgi:general secretion pathway protein D